MARPTKYTTELVDKARHYVDNYEDYDDLIPSVAGLASVVGTCRETLHVWAKQDGKKELSNILGQLKTEQERVLISNGLNSTFNPTIVKLVLGKHGYSDKQQLEHSGEVKIERVMYTEQAGKKKPAPGRLSRLNEN